MNDHIWTDKETNLSFRKLNKSDLEDLNKLKNESWFGTHRISIVNIDDQIKWYDSLDRNPHTPSHLFLICELITNESIKIGTFKFNSIDWYSKRAEVGWDVFHSLRGKGFGKKIVKAGVGFAVDVLNLHRLTAEILETNKASQKCAEEAGFNLEGTKLKEILKNNEYVDNRIYGIILD